jgi:hypothetical protein
MVLPDLVPICREQHFRQRFIPVIGAAAAMLRASAHDRSLFPQIPHGRREILYVPRSTFLQRENPELWTYPENWTAYAGSSFH